MLLLPKSVYTGAAGALFCLGLALMSHASPVSSPPAVKPPAVSPAAVAIIEQSVAAYEHLQSLTETIHGLMGTVNVAIKAPDCYSYRLTSDLMTVLRAAEVCDGKSVMLEVVDDTQHYYILPMPTVDEVSGQSEDLGLFMTIPYPGQAPSTLESIIDSPSAFTSIQVGAPSRVDGVAVNNIYVTAKGPNNDVVTLVYSIGTTDCLLRKISGLDYSNKKDNKPTIQDIETDANVAANQNVSQASFALKPDTGHSLGSTDQLYGAFTGKMQHGPLRIGSLAPALNIEDSDGKPISIAPGRLTLVEFWSAESPPGTEQMPIIAAAYAKYHDQGFDVVALSIDRTVSADKDYVSKHPVNFVEAWPSAGALQALAASYGIAAMPYGVLVGKDGTVLAVDPKGPLLDLALQHYLNGN